MAYTMLATILLAAFVGSSDQVSVYSVDDTGGPERRFDGQGSISGGGATSKLLMNYPEQQRNEILDYLFKPNYGASLHILKVEIGGDAQSTDGGEASHMHESWDENYRRGYEWWLMTEAKKRNPGILLYALPWAFPPWIGNGTYSAFANVSVTADYVIRWINAAQTVYNLRIDYIGIWNERNYSSSYIKTLRTMLDARGLINVRICAPDQHDWLIVDDMNTDRELKRAVDFIGTHYPDGLSSQAAVNIGTQLWASEDHGFSGDDPNQSASCRARMLNLNYVIGRMTATLSWNLIQSYYNGLPHPGSGLMTAIEPWSGHYTVDAPIWVSAHTTQFTKPGWWYLRHGAGVGKLSGGGSYVSFVNPADHSLTIVIETMSNQSVCIDSPYVTGPQQATFQLAGNFASVSLLNVWYTKLGFGGSPSVYFKRMEPIQVVNGAVSLSLGVDEVYTLTTVTAGQKGTAPDPPPSAPFPLPYTDDFDEYPAQVEPNNLAQQVGIWQVERVAPPHNGVIRQVVTRHPVFWCWGGGVHPKDNNVNVIGNFSWSDIYVQTDVRIPPANGTDGVFVAARVDRGGCHVSDALGVFFIVYPAQQRYEVTNDLARHQMLSSGPLTLNTDWNTIALLVKGDVVTGMANGKTAFSISTPSQPTNGFAGIGSVPYGQSDWDNLELRSAEDGDRRLRARTAALDTLYFNPDN